MLKADFHTYVKRENMRKLSFTELEEATSARERDKEAGEKDTFLQNIYNQEFIYRLDAPKLVVLRANVFPFRIFQTDLL